MSAPLPSLARVLLACRGADLHLTPQGYVRSKSLRDRAGNAACPLVCGIRLASFSLLRNSDDLVGAIAETAGDRPFDVIAAADSGWDVIPRWTCGRSCGREPTYHRARALLLRLCDRGKP